MQKRRCPYLGLDTDPTTVMAYPTLRNCCHRVQTEEPVNLNYQLTHCFTFAHRHCPVLLDQVTEGLPPEIGAYSTKKRATIALWVVIASGMLTVMFVLLFGDWQWGGANGGFLDFNGNSAQQETMGTPTLLQELIGSPTPTLTLTPIASAVLSATPQSTETQLPTDIPETEELTEPTITFTNVPVATRYPTWTPGIPAATSTPLPNRTATLSPSSTSQPTETELPTNTPPLPTETPIPDTPVPTNTVPPPSDTPIPLPTNTPLPPSTSTPIPLPPTNTPNP